jgi:hypothetical protein
MSGPPYPHPNPAPGSNAIGSFQIGVSPVGDIPTFDEWQTVISQYGNSPIMDMLITCFNMTMDQTENFDQFFDTIFNIMTAEGYGLDLWGRILGITRVLSIPANFFGFEEPQSWQGFGQGPFFSGETTGSSFSLADDPYRLLLLAKAASNIWDGSIKQLNQILLNLFQGLGNCFVVDGLDLTMTYTFDFPLSPVNLAIVNSGVLPRTSGVSTSIVQRAP